MQPVIETIRRIRMVNLLITGLFLSFFQYYIIIPVFQSASVPPGLDSLSFSLFLVSILCIAAGGNLWNDYSDYNLDVISKPDKGKSLSPRVMAISAQILILTGTIIGIWLSVQAKQSYLIYFFMLSSLSLILYSLILKSIPLIGNVVVALLCALPVVILVNLNYSSFEQNTLQFISAETENSIRMVIRLQLIGYGGFAFLINFIRELTKDIEDEAGDRMFHIQTFPVRFGISAAKYLATFLMCTTMGLLSWLQWYIFTLDRTPRQFWYILFTVQFSLLIAVFSTLPVIRQKEMAFTNLFLKLIMLQGVLSIPLFFYWSKSL